MIPNNKYNPDRKTINQLAKEYGFNPNKLRRRHTGEVDFRTASIGTYRAPKGTMNSQRDCQDYIWQQFAQDHGVSKKEFDELWKYDDGKDRLGQRIGVKNLNDYVVHERRDGRTCDIIPAWVNDLFKHKGGVAYQKDGRCSRFFRF